MTEEQIEQCDLAAEVRKYANMEPPLDIPGQQRYFGHDVPAARERLIEILRWHFGRGQLENLACVCADLAGGEYVSEDD